MAGMVVAVVAVEEWVMVWRAGGHGLACSKERTGGDGLACPKERTGVFVVVEGRRFHGRHCVPHCATAFLTAPLRSSLRHCLPHSRNEEDPIPNSNRQFPGHRSGSANPRNESRACHFGLARPEFGSPKPRAKPTNASVNVPMPMR